MLFCAGILTAAVVTSLSVLICALSVVHSSLPLFGCGCAALCPCQSLFVRVPCPPSGALLAVRKKTSPIPVAYLHKTLNPRELWRFVASRQGQADRKPTGTGPVLRSRQSRQGQAPFYGRILTVVGLASPARHADRPRTVFIIRNRLHPSPIEFSDFFVKHAHASISCAGAASLPHASRFSPLLNGLFSQKTPIRFTTTAPALSAPHCILHLKLLCREPHRSSCAQSVSVLFCTTTSPKARR